jgi:hypothetical protein
MGIGQNSLKTPPIPPYQGKMACEAMVRPQGGDYTTMDERTQDAGTVPCPFCKEPVIAGALKCRHCGSNLAAAKKSNAAAGCLGLLLGPVGLWYKGHWAAGFAWLAMAIVFGVASGGWLAPVFWIGMAIHAAVAKPKG